MQIILEVFISFLVLVWLGLLSINISGFRSKKADPKEVEGYRPKVLVMLPCRGVDITLGENIKSLRAQDYKNYMLIGIVDSKDDPAVPVLEENRVDYIISKSVCLNCSGKVRAIATAYETFIDYEVYVIADSDVLARKDWLTKLVSKLSDKSIGIATSFPLFKPMGGLWTRVKMVWGFVGDGMMESNLTRFGWGGTLAFRKELLSGEWLEKFKSSLSDDIAITRAAKAQGLKIGYVRERISVVNSDDDFKKFKEWSNRQTALSILGNRRVLHYGLVIYAANALLLVSSVALSIMVSYAYIILFAPFVIGIAKTYMRAKGNRTIGLWLIYLFANFVYLANLVSASRMHEITWRGNRYSLESHNQ